jgi:hypothetical protein
MTFYLGPFDLRSIPKHSNNIAMSGLSLLRFVASRELGRCILEAFVLKTSAAKFNKFTAGLCGSQFRI